MELNIKVATRTRP